MNKSCRRLSSGRQTTRVKPAHGRGHGIQKPHLCQLTRSNNRRRWQRPLPGLPSDQLRHGERLAPGPDCLETRGVTDDMRPRRASGRLASEGLPGAGEPLGSNAPPDCDSYKNGHQSNEAGDQRFFALSIGRDFSDFSQGSIGLCCWCRSAETDRHR